MTPQQSAQVMEAMGQVTSAIERARKKWSATSRTAAELLTGADGTAKQVLGAIKSIEKTTNNWIKRAGSIGNEDTEGWERWNKEGKEIAKNLADIAQDAEETSVTAVISGTAKESIKDTRKAVTEYAPSIFKWAIIAAVIVMIIYVGVKIK